MKTVLVSLSILLCLSFANQKKTKIIFFGDSITNAGGWPGGYILHIDTLCRKEGLSDKFEFIPAGQGGNKVYDLFLRLEEDVLKKKPDVVVIFIGINDVWHKYLFGTGTDPDKFVKFYQAIIDRLRASKINTVLCTPSAIGEKTDYTNPYDGTLDEFCERVRMLASANKLTLIDLRKSFRDYNLKHNTGNAEWGVLTFPGDGVHLSRTGNMFVAEEMWNTLKSIK